MITELYMCKMWILKQLLDVPVCSSNAPRSTAIQNKDDVIRHVNWNAIGNDIALGLSISLFFSVSLFRSLSISMLYPCGIGAFNTSYNFVFNVNTDSTHLITYYLPLQYLFVVVVQLSSERSQFSVFPFHFISFYFFIFFFSFLSSLVSAV